ncbi:MAG: SH3 domain-containing protein, partial [Chloroflexi bacterium]|nr:SH3 domain-containing protein [Chloroflexota bacterium]
MRLRPSRRASLVATLALALALLAPTPALALEPGTTAVVDADGDCLRLRADPGLGAQVLACLPDGSTVRVLSGLRPADGFEWQLVDSGAARTGWVVTAYLRALASAPSAATAPPATPAIAAPAATLTGSVPPAGGFALVVWSGGPVDAAVSTARAAGCTVAAVWANRSGGGLVGYLVDAPTFVNAPWTDQHGSAPLPAATPLIVVCRYAAEAAPPNAPAA